ncbi:MAG: MarR family transcriptional regulator [Burkholderiales bacterium]
MASKQSGRARGNDLDPGPLPGLLGYQLRLAQLAVFRDFERSAGDLGVSPGRFGLLALVEANPGVSQSRLAHAVGLDRSTMVAVLDQLEDRELVERRDGPDRRTNGLWLTREGKRLVAQLKRRITEHEARIAGRLTPAERATLFRLLRRLGP